ncbi:MAG: DUF547 domain-containing protein [Chloroflexi bacterium OHK40]
MNELVNLREAALRLLGGARGAETLNGESPPGGGSTDLVAALETGLRALKNAAISADGAHVDYGALKASAAYAAYRAEIAARLPSFNPASLASRDERLAFWINLYNALILDAVVAYEVRGSVTKAGPALGFFRRAAYIVGGQRLSADDIEHGVLRSNAGNPYLPGPQFAPGDPRAAWVITPIDPRIHCALNCASRSCPPIAAYSAARMDAQLELAARAFIDADTTIDERRGVLHVSTIFQWYRADFGGLEGVVRFVCAHLPPSDPRRRWIESRAEVDLAFKPYDWALNTP